MRGGVSAVALVASLSGCGLLLDTDPQRADGSAGSDAGVGDAGAGDATLADGAGPDASVDADCDRYVAVGGTGDGITPTTPMGAIQMAVDDLPSEGGRVCVGGCGDSFLEMVSLRSNVIVAGGYSMPDFTFVPPTGDPSTDCLAAVVGSWAPTPVVHFPSGVVAAGIERLLVTNADSLGNMTAVLVEGQGTIVSSHLVVDSEAAAWALDVTGDVMVARSMLEAASVSTTPAASVVAAAGIRSTGLVTVTGSKMHGGALTSAGVGIYVMSGTATIADNLDIEGRTDFGEGVGVLMQGDGQIVGNDRIAGEGVPAYGVLLRSPGSVVIADNVDISALVLDTAATAAVREGYAIFGASCTTELVVQGQDILHVEAEGPVVYAAAVELRSCNAHVTDNGQIIGLESDLTAANSAGIACRSSSCTIERSDVITGRTGSGPSTVGAVGIVCVEGPGCVIREIGDRLTGMSGGIRGCDGADQCIGINIAATQATIDTCRFLPHLHDMSTGLDLEGSDVVVTNSLFLTTNGMAVAVSAPVLTPTVLHSSTFVRMDGANQDPLVRSRNGIVNLVNDVFACIGSGANASVVSGLAAATSVGSGSMGCNRLHLGVLLMNNLDGDPFVSVATDDYRLDAIRGMAVGDLGVSSTVGRLTLPPLDYFGSTRSVASPSAGFHELP